MYAKAVRQSANTHSCQPMPLAAAVVARSSVGPDPSLASPIPQHTSVAVWRFLIEGDKGMTKGRQTF